MHAERDRAELLVRRLALGVALVALALAALTIAAPTYPPSTDAPAHLLAANVLLHPDRYEGQYVTQHALTGQGHVVLTAFVGRWLPVLTASRLVLVLGLLTLAAGYASSARRIGASPAAALAIASLAFVGWPYAMGFYSFLLANAFAAVAMAAYLRRHERWAYVVVAALWFAAAAWSHAIAAGMFIAWLGLAALFARGWRGLDLRAWLCVAPGLGWAVFSSVTTLGNHAAIGGVAATAAERLPPGEQVQALLMTGVASYSQAAALTAALLTALLVASALRRASGGAEATSLARAGGVFLLGFLVMPFHGLGWHFAGPRMLYVAQALAPGLLVARSGRGASIMALAVAMAAALPLAHGLPHALAESDRIAQVAEHYPRQTGAGLALTVVYHAEPFAPIAPHVRPFGGTPMYATFSGGAIPGAFAYHPTGHSMRFAEAMAQLFPRTRLLLLDIGAPCLNDPACGPLDIERADMVAAIGTKWDSVIIAGAPRAFIERLWSRGFVPIEDSPFVLRARPAIAEAVIRVPDGLRGAPIVYRAAYADGSGWFRGGTAPASADRPAEITIRFDALPAGDLVFEIFADVDEDGELGGSDHGFVTGRQLSVLPGAYITLQTDALMGGPRR